MSHKRAAAAEEAAAESSAASKRRRRAREEEGRVASYIDRLPTEVLFDMLCRMDEADAFRLGATERRVRQIVTQPSFIHRCLMPKDCWVAGKVAFLDYRESLSLAGHDMGYVLQGVAANGVPFIVTVTADFQAFLNQVERELETDPQSVYDRYKVLLQGHGDDDLDLDISDYDWAVLQHAQREELSIAVNAGIPDKAPGEPLTDAEIDAVLLAIHFALCRSERDSKARHFDRVFYAVRVGGLRLVLNRTSTPYDFRLAIRQIQAAMQTHV
ncbi:Hypothetical protein UVM_LOCUS328 [uncultured virus]|nr:Hypothetical protein UVM_LOCUS328 [uncultured virus]